ncbi:hypothetical protein A8L45_00215 [Veronia pacifica]|uniref:Uncharacterized protein n=1 Tax=Veronia pacifica TaxID=1080227 RepID=A0A1C3ESR2_9GAMM|nr:hypothetical protein A8L45_00215 [Veronia pacifica]
MLSQLAAFKTDAIENTLGAIPAFKNYKLNSATSSIVVEYDATLIDPTWVDAFFSDSSDAAEQACISIANSINVNGVNQ